MLDDWVPIFVLAIVAVVVATLSVGYALSWASALPLGGVSSDRCNSLDDRPLGGGLDLPVDLGAAQAGADHRGRKAF